MTDISRILPDADLKERHWMMPEMTRSKPSTAGSNSKLDGAFPDLPFVSHHEDIATGDHEFVQDISVIIHLGVGYY